MLSVMFGNKMVFKVYLRHGCMDRWLAFYGF